MEADAENDLPSYLAQIQLINPFQNKVSIVSNSNSSPSRRHPDETFIAQDDMNSNTESAPPEHSPEHFVDKKYYDIFKQ